MKIYLVLLVLLFSCSTEKKETDKQREELYTYDVEARLQELNIKLNEPDNPIATYSPFVKVGNLLYLSGNGPKLDNGTYISGKVGKDISLEEAKDAARLTGIRILSVIKSAIGDLNKVKRIVKVTGMVNAVPEFKYHPAVINGFSDLMLDVFGDRGRHARSAIGMGSLPYQIAVEIEVIVEVID